MKHDRAGTCPDCGRDFTERAAAFGCGLNEHDQCPHCASKYPCEGRLAAPLDDLYLQAEAAGAGVGVC